MFPKTLQRGAILIADAHCAPWRTPFIDFLYALESGRIVTPQLILMGDIFDLLFGPITATHRLNQEGIDLLNRLSLRVDIVYLEGNHDFRLQPIFPNIHVIERAYQPLICNFEGKRIALSHGDCAMGFGYECYTALIRNRPLLYVLRGIDAIGGGFIVRWLEKQMQRKHHCKTIKNFQPLIEKRLRSLYTDTMDILIEGHFHQNSTFELLNIYYINVGAFACNERYFTVQSIPNEPLLHETLFRKEPE